MKYRSSVIAVLALQLWSGVALAANITLDSKDKAGMYLSNGVDVQGHQHVLWSRMNANAMNPNGFITDDFIPYCVISYHVSKLVSHWSKDLSAPMRLTMQGPEYGVAATLDGPGNYQWQLNYLPPSAGGFYRHIDKATGVEPWWKPFEITYKFHLDAKGNVQEIKQ